MVLGNGLGLLLSPSGVALLFRGEPYGLAQWVALPGQLFQAAIHKVIIPLVISSIILGITSSGDASFLKRRVCESRLTFLSPPHIAVVLGITMKTVLRPGNYINAELVQPMTGDTPHTVTAAGIAQEDISITQQIVQLVPANPSQSLVDKDMFAIVVYAIFIGVALLELENVRANWSAAC